jgi:hypothetical protein
MADDFGKGLGWSSFQARETSWFGVEGDDGQLKYQWFMIERWSFLGRRLVDFFPCQFPLLFSSFFSSSLFLTFCVSAHVEEEYPPIIYSPLCP